jgi:hypothetical protein
VDALTGGVSSCNGQVYGGLPDFLASESRQMIAIATLTAALLFIYDGLQVGYCPGLFTIIQIGRAMDSTRREPQIMAAFGELLAVSN